eukprot:763362-Hanusia_phi.AAC.3
MSEIIAHHQRTQSKFENVMVSGCIQQDDGDVNVTTDVRALKRTWNSSDHIMQLWARYLASLSIMESIYRLDCKLKME